MIDMNRENISVILHRGAHQIGGVCTEIRTENTRILFDLGMPLEGEGQKNPLRIAGVTEGDADCDGVFLTHYHGDHVGEIPHLLQGIPVYMGSAAREILEAEQNHKKCLGEKVWAADVKTMEPENPVQVGDLKVRAIRSDHSAFDTLMYLVEGFGKKVLLTGDFRFHGFHGEELKDELRKIGSVNLMIVEGTNLTRESFKTCGEAWVEEKFREIVKKYRYVFLFASSSNLDRIASFTRVIPRGKYILTDRYQKSLLEIAKKYTKFPDYISPKVLVYGRNLDGNIEKRGFGMVVRAHPKFLPMIEAYFQNHPEETCMIYSAWSGYRENLNIKKMLGLCSKVLSVHVSGHVTKQDLLEAVDLVSPMQVILHHTSASDEEEDTLPIKNLVHLNDEEILKL